jgi:hypothetical protein
MKFEYNITSTDENGNITNLGSVLKDYERFVICSDIHGNLSRLEAIIKHSELDITKDKLIHLGDCCDIGPYTYQVMETLEAHDALFMVGNHEAAHVLQQKIHPYDKKLDCGPFNFEWRKMIRDRKAKFVIEIEGYILSHAGISETIFEQYSTMSDRWWELLDEDMYAAVMHNDSTHRLLWRDDCPLWFRPYEWEEPGEVLQIVGHTPRHTLSQIALADFETTYIDGYDADGSVTYAVIDDLGVVEQRFMPNPPIQMYQM